MFITISTFFIPGNMKATKKIVRIQLLATWVTMVKLGLFRVSRKEFCYFAKRKSRKSEILLCFLCIFLTTCFAVFSIFAFKGMS
jgi:hypothetical protein